MNNMSKNFMGLDDCVFWFGVVESRQDPLGLGRVQVRCYAWHNPSLSDIPSAYLAWASVSHALNFRGFGTPREADSVWGIFTDGRNAQSPLVIGIIPGYFTIPPNTGQGFGDLRSQATLVYAPKHPIGRTYKTDGSGIIISEANTANSQVLESFRHPNADELGKNSITGVSRYQNLANTVIQARKNNLDKNIYTANNIQWSEPYPAYNPLYPYNSALETESGHVFELDDTPGYERIHIAHRSGSYVEWFPTGTKVQKITKSNYSIVMADDMLHVMGKVMITVDSDALIRVKGDVILEGGGKLSANIAGDVNYSIGGNFNIKAQNVNIDASADISLISQSQHLTPSQSMDISTETLNETASGAVNINAGSGANFQSGSDMNILSGGAGNFSASGEMSVGTISMDSGVTSITGSSITNPVVNGVILPEGSVSTASGASSAAPGQATGLPAAISALTKNTGQAAPEEVPVPIPGPFLPNYDPETGTAFKQQQLLVTSANNTLVPPDANANANTANCTFDPNSHTYLSDPSTWAVSAGGLNLIQSFEGFAKVVSADMATAYPDPATGGEPLTIGYGSTAVGIGQPVTLGELISRATAESFLEESINTTFLPGVRQLITVPITQNMLDAILSFCYNCGVGNFRKSSILSNLNAGNICAAGNAFLLWNKAAGKIIPGLTSRRQQERSLFLQ